MKLRHFLYNAFILESEGVKIAIDPGRNLLWYKLFSSLIPKSEWEGVTHILVTHGDPDHFVFTVPMAKKAKAQVICRAELAEEITSKKVEIVQTIEVGELINLKGFQVEGLKVAHGPFKAKLLSGLLDIEAEKQVRSHGVINSFLG